MSQISYAWEQAPVMESPVTPSVAWVEPSKRSIWQPILMVFPVLLAGGGYFFDAPMLTDLSFLAMSAFMAVFLVMELGRFSERFGMGGVVVFAGVLIWFSYDYFQTWFLRWLPHWNGMLPAGTVASAAFSHVLFVLCMVIGLRIRSGRWFSKLLTKFPEPPKPSNYFWIVIVTQVVGLMPYFVFTREPFYMALYHSIVMGRTGGAAWTVGRTGNANYSYGGYVAQILSVGVGGALLAMFCVIYLRQNFIKNAICIFIWLLWLALGFGTGTRGEMVKMIMPVVGFLFIRYHVEAQQLLRRFSVRAYVVAAIILFCALVLVQIQAQFRDVGFQSVQWSDVSLSDVEGNAMFSSTLQGFYAIPAQHPFFLNNFPGEAVILPIPNFIYWCAIAPMPRAFWTTKPIDPANSWYNAIFTGRSTMGGGAVEGTTISQGAVGYWYFRFGIVGVIEGGLFCGWLLGIFERALFNNHDRPMSFFAALALLTWMFRSYRGIDPAILAETMVLLAGLVISMFVARPFLSLLSKA